MLIILKNFNLSLPTSDRMKKTLKKTVKVLLTIWHEK